MLNVLANPGIYSWRLLLLAALLLGTLALTLGVDLSSEGAIDSQFSSRNASNIDYLLFPAKSEPVQDKDLGSQKNTRNLAVVQCNTKEVQGATPVHRRAGYVEREPGDGSIHENAEVVAKVGTRHTKSPHAGENQDGTDSKQDTSNDGLVDRSVEGLVS